MVASISAMQLRASIGDVLNRIQYRGERVVVERKGEPVAAIIGVADLRRLETLEAERELELVAMAKELLAREDPCRTAATRPVHRAVRRVAGITRACIAWN